jgi:hypothetical protein
MDGYFKIAKGVNEGQIESMVWAGGQRTLSAHAHAHSAAGIGRFALQSLSIFNRKRAHVRPHFFDCALSLSAISSVPRQ